jgi:hypothetical protein
MKKFSARGSWPKSNRLEEASSMHDVLVALAFVAMVACPAIVAAIPKNDIDEDN